jgi:hypothetical protein
MPRAIARLHHYLDAAVLFLAERLIHTWCVVQRHAMGDDERRIDVSPLDVLEQPRHVLVHVGLTHLERQALRECPAKRELVEPSAVHAGNGDRAALAARANRLTKGVGAIGREVHGGLHAVVPGIERRAVRFEPDGIDAGVRSLSSCQFTQRVRNIDFLVVEDMCPAVRGGHRQSLRKTIDGNDAFGTEQKRALDGELTDRATSPDRGPYDLA